jgi:predicted alpha/beta-fold hydrolase
VSFFKQEYVRDMVFRANNEGSTVAIMVARGLMDLPIRGFNCFHGARWEDAHVSAQTIKAAMEQGQVLAGVGKIFV